MDIVWILLVFVLKSFLFGYSCNCSEVNALGVGKWSIYYEFLKTASLEGGKSECKSQIEKIFRAINKNEVWALKALDASGSVSNSFIYQQNFWHGSKLACELLGSEKRPWMSAGYNVEVINEKSPFKTKYFTVFANYSTKNQIPQMPNAYVPYIPFQLGVCAPESCSKDQVLEAIKPVLGGGELLFQQLYNVTFEVLSVRTENLENFMAREYAVMCYLMAVVVLVLVMNLFGTDSATKWGRFSACFNLRKNFQQLMSTTRPKESIECLDGIRSIIYIWAVVSHIFFFSFFVYENSVELMYIGREVGFQLIFLAGVFFESFFVMSAFLLTYSFLNNKRLQNAIISNGLLANIGVYLKFWLIRYIRFTPALLLSVALVRLTTVYIEEATHLYSPGTIDNNCLTNCWWRVILYIQSFYPHRKMCVPWSWYLSCDMFYYSVTLLGLLIFVKSPLIGKVCFFVLLISSNVYSFLLYYWEDFEIGFDKLQGTIDKLYIAPLARANSYFAGIIGGYLLYSVKDFSSQLNQRVELVWNALQLLGIVVLFTAMLFPENFSPIFIQLLNTTGRFIFGCIVMGTIIIVNTRTSGAMKSLLCSKFFAHFSKLTYMMYLLNPIIIYAYRAAGGSSLRANVANIIIEGFGIAVVCYFVSLFAKLFFEIPYSRLTSEYLMKQKPPLLTAKTVNETHIDPNSKSPGKTSSKIKNTGNEFHPRRIMYKNS